MFPIKYPNDFRGREKAVDVDNDEINQMIQECLTKLENDFENADCTIETGNAIVHAARYEDYYEITVSKNYFRAQISREEG